MVKNEPGLCPKCNAPMIQSFKTKNWYCSKMCWKIGEEDQKPLTPKVESVHIKNETSHNMVLNKTDMPHSFEYGKAGNRHKIYYNTIKELKVHMDELVTEGLAEEIGFEGLPNETR